MTIEIPKGYETLGEALAAAVEQAAVGKGAGRHSYGGELFPNSSSSRYPGASAPAAPASCWGRR